MQCKNKRGSGATPTGASGARMAKTVGFSYTATPSMRAADGPVDGADPEARAIPS